MSLQETPNLFNDLYTKDVRVWAREKGFCGKNARIAVIDTGIIRQTEFLGRCVAKIPNTDLWRKNTTYEQDASVGTHGTEVAVLIHLIAPEAIIYDVKAVAIAGTTIDQSIIAALKYCVDTIKPDIINMSLGTHQLAACDANCALDQMVNYVADQGILIVASAGNRGSQGPLACPASAQGAIAVGGASYKKKRAEPKVSDISSWSWYEGKPDLLAPADIPVRVRYYHKLTAWMEITIDEAHLGTSYAAPFVTGALALLLQLKKQSKEPTKFYSDLRAAIIGSAKPLKGYSKQAQGNGLIDIPSAAKALGVKV
ncbi:MAG: S8 family serine peptidase [Candidatus Bathyarchaeia archaeon]|jgi:subtilisin family serine protease